MDIGFEILIPCDTKLSAIKFDRPVYEFDGIKYPQGQDEADFHYFKLIKSEVPQHVLAFLPDSLRDNKWQCISVIEGVDELIEELQQIEKGRIGIECKLLELLKILISDTPKWVVIFEPDYDCLDFFIEGNIDTVFEEILKCLNRKRTGFIIWNNTNHLS